jgi:hypothetical protein
LKTISRMDIAGFAMTVASWDIPVTTQGLFHTQVVGVMFAMKKNDKSRVKELKMTSEFHFKNATPRVAKSRDA